MKLLKGYGFHVQKSVFECILSEPKLKKLLELLEEKIDPATDSIRVYQLCNDCNKTILVYGQGKVSEISLVEIV